MARTSVLTGGSNSAQTTSEDLNGYATDILSADGVVGALTNTASVAPMTGGLAVNAQGSPNTTSAVTTGIAYVTATPTSQGSQRLRVKIDAQNITHASNSTGSTRYDWIYVKVDAALAANPIADMSTTGTIVVSRSTSNSVDNGTPPTYGYNIAIVTLANNWTTVTNGTIADKRSQLIPSIPLLGITNSMLAQNAAWTTYAPSYTNFSLGNGTLTYAKYQQIGKTVHVKFRAVLGSSSSVTNDIKISLPVTAASDYVAISPLGAGFFYDNSATTYYLGYATFETTTTFAILMSNKAGGTSYVAGNYVGTAVPAAPAASDILMANFTYEAA